MQSLELAKYQKLGANYSLFERQKGITYFHKIYHVKSAERSYMLSVGVRCLAAMSTAWSRVAKTHKPIESSSLLVINIPEIYSSGEEITVSN